MKAMILAAGRGERMRPLSDDTPKPLLKVVGKPLIVHLIERLVMNGYQELIINLAHLGAKIRDRLGDGGEFGARIDYSDEGEQALGTAGGIRNALPLLGHDRFLAVSGDLWTDYPFTDLRDKNPVLAHLVMVENPSYHSQGDFVLRDGKIVIEAGNRLTFGNIGVYSPELFARHDPAERELGPILRDAARSASVSGERFDDEWMNVGTPSELEALNRRLGANP